MIVKNERAVILRCLESVKPLIDYWVIVDTGSTDGTQETILKYMKDIPGELHECSWVDFGFNRTQALNLAKGKADYLLFMDADDWLEYTSDFKLPELTENVYGIWRGNHSVSYLMPQLVKSALPWIWKGVLHEYLDCSLGYFSIPLQGLYYVQTSEGSRSQDPEKYQKHVRILEEALKQDPTNTRYAFYLAESYRDAGDPANAIRAYQHRIEMGGWEEEIYWSLLQIGKLRYQQNDDRTLVLSAFYEAWRFRPSRIEASYYIAALYNEMQRFDLAYVTLTTQRSLPPAQDILFNEEWITHWGLAFQLSIAAYYVHDYQGSLTLCDQLLDRTDLPVNIRESILSNRQFSVSQLTSSVYKPPSLTSLLKTVRDQEATLPSEEILQLYQDIEHLYPMHVEPLYYLSCYYRTLERHEEAFNTGKQALPLLRSLLVQPVEQWIYDYGMIWEFSLTAYTTGRFKQAMELNTTLIDNPKVPPIQHPILKKNQYYYRIGDAIEKMAIEKWNCFLPTHLPKLHVCTVATEVNSCLQQLIHSCNAHGISLKILGLGITDFTLGIKLDLVREYLNSLPDEDILLFVDGYDTLILADEKAILNKFITKNVPVVFSTETNCHPFPVLAPYYPTSTTRFKYLNSGVYMGYVYYLKFLLDSVTPAKDAIEDQGVMTTYYLHHPSSISLDTQCDLFLSLFQVQPSEIHIDHHQVCLLETNTLPCVVHGNGPGKKLYQQLYDTLFAQNK